MENIISEKIVDINDLFDDDFLDAKKLYLHTFNLSCPVRFFIGQIDGEKAFTAFIEKFAGKIIRVYQYRWYDKKKKRLVLAEPSSFLTISV